VSSSKPEVENENCIRIGWEDFSVSVLPNFGGKITSIRLGQCELLQAPLTSISARSPVLPYDQSDASGWDECLPSVSPCEVNTIAGVARVPDHGDLWRVPWAVLERDAFSCTMAGRCFSLPLQLRRTASVSRAGGGSRLDLEYRLSNVGTYSTPWAWSAHPLFAVMPGDRILLPESLRSVRVEGSIGERLGEAGGIAEWPVAKRSGGGIVNLSIAQGMETGHADKLFAGPLKENENWCVLERRSAGVRIRMSFDAAATPFLGLWLCYGGWPARSGPKQMCVAFEPTTCGVDSLPCAGQWQRELEPGASDSWKISTEFQST
jgi:galactose mutarotase-like enzyme